MLRHTLENLAKNAAKFLKCIRPLWDIMHQLVHDGGPYHIETSPLVCRANQRTGFYTIWISVMKGFKC